MCGRFEQSGTRRYYASALGVETSDWHWQTGDHIPLYNVALGMCPGMLMLRGGRLEFIGMTWGYHTPAEAAAKRKPWINARIEKESADGPLLPAHVPGRTRHHSGRRLAGVVP